jgi:peroxiredoxin
VLGYNSADDRQIALDLLKKNELTFPNILDPSDAATMIAMQSYRATGVPLTYIIDREGKVAEAWYGYQPNDPRGLNVLRKLGIE